MPVTVVVRSASAPRLARWRAGAAGAPSLTFDGSRIVIGRGSGSDVRLPDPSVSTRHATIRATGNDYAIVDEGSTNGTWVGGVKLLAAVAARRENRRSGARGPRVARAARSGRRPPTPDLGLATRDLAFALVQRAMDAVGDDTVAKVRVAEGPDIGEELRLAEEGRAYVIGRAETAISRSPTPTRRASTRSSRGAAAQILLRDLGSRNGVFLGDSSAHAGSRRRVARADDGAHRPHGPRARRAGERRARGARGGRRRGRCATRHPAAARPPALARRAGGSAPARFVDSGVAAPVTQVAAGRSPRRSAADTLAMPRRRGGIAAAGR